MSTKNKSHTPEIQLSIEKEYARYQKALAKLRKEQEATRGMMIDDREQDLLENHYRRIAKISSSKHDVTTK